MPKKVYSLTEVQNKMTWLLGLIEQAIQLIDGGYKKNKNKVLALIVCICFVCGCGENNPAMTRDDKTPVNVTKTVNETNNITEVKGILTDTQLNTVKPLIIAGATCLSAVSMYTVVKLARTLLPGSLNIMAALFHSLSKIPKVGETCRLKKIGTFFSKLSDFIAKYVFGDDTVWEAEAGETITYFDTLFEVEE
jgi:hypothetical protein